jgi:hypothetical protein
MTKSFDQTLFAWHSCYDSSGLLAKRVSDFKNMQVLGLWSPIMLAPFTMTNVGLSIRVPFVDKSPPHDPDAQYIALQCDIKTGGRWKVLLICLKEVVGSSCRINGKIVKAYRRIQTPGWPSLGGLRLHRDYCEDILVLEDDHIELVQQSFDDDQRRWTGPPDDETQREMIQWFHGELKD